MKPRIVTLDEFFVVGIGVDCKSNDIASLRLLWDKFLPRMGEIKGSVGVCGVCSYFDVAGDFYYLVGCKVDQVVEIPQGMEVWKVMPHRYLVIGFSGQQKKMGKQWQEAVNRLLPESGVLARPDGPWLELYAERSASSEAGEVTCDLYTPIAG